MIGAEGCVGGLGERGGRCGSRDRAGSCVRRLGSGVRLRLGVGLRLGVWPRSGSGAPPPLRFRVRPRLGLDSEGSSGGTGAASIGAMAIRAKMRRREKIMIISKVVDSIELVIVGWLDDDQHRRVFVKV